MQVDGGVIEFPNRDFQNLIWRKFQGAPERTETRTGFLFCRGAERSLSNLNAQSFVGFRKTV